MSNSPTVQPERLRAAPRSRRSFDSTKLRDKSGDRLVAEMASPDADVSQKRKLGNEDGRFFNPEWE